MPEMDKEQEERALELVKKKPEAFRDLPFQTERICLAAVNRDGELLRYVREQTRKICRAAVKKRGIALRFAEFQDDDICETAASQDGESLRYARFQKDETCMRALLTTGGKAIRHAKRQTEALCLEAIRIDGNNLALIREPSALVIREAVKREPSAISHVAEQTEGLCSLAIQVALHRDAWNIAQVIESCAFQDRELCMDAVSKRPELLPSVREKTPEMRSIALSRGQLDELPRILGSIPDPSDDDWEAILDNFSGKMIRDGREIGGQDRQYVVGILGSLLKSGKPSPEIQSRALGISGMLLPFVDRSEENIRKAISRDGNAIKFLPESMRAPLRLPAVRSRGEALMHLSNQTGLEIMAAVENDPRALRHADFQTEEICLAAVKRDGMAIIDVWKQTEEICMAAVERNPDALEFVIDITPEMAVAAVEKDGMALKHVPARLQTRELVSLAVEQELRALWHAEKALLDSQICLSAVERDPELIAYVPQSLWDGKICGIAADDPEGIQAMTDIMVTRRNAPPAAMDAIKSACAENPELAGHVAWRLQTRDLYRAIIAGRDGKPDAERIRFLEGMGRVNEDELRAAVDGFGKPADRQRM